MIRNLTFHQLLRTYTLAKNAKCYTTELSADTLILNACLKL
jgi:hypothetical protein